MATSPSLNCPGCGGPVLVENRAVRMVVCSYCAGLLEVVPGGVQIAGAAARMAPLPTQFRVGQTGRIRGTLFHILGRVRYAYDEGVWDEWYLGLGDGQAAWLEEDDGEYVLARPEELRTPAPPFEQLRVGTQVSVNGYSFMITERCRARVASAEGQLFRNARMNRPVQFAEGNVGGRI
ncbi:MAG: DUF4178 domain-containing protein, partial [SAR202 cluster bacterium]|nr:DUF4178 domain-containing protein [SAR202 cluster bacterium]